MSALFTFLGYYMSIKDYLPKSVSIPRMKIFMYWNITLTVCAVGNMFIIHVINKMMEVSTMFCWSLAKLFV